MGRDCAPSRRRFPQSAHFLHAIAKSTQEGVMSGAAVGVGMVMNDVRRVFLEMCTCHSERIRRLGEKSKDVSASRLISLFLAGVDLSVD